MPELAEQNRAQAEERSDREIDARRDDDRGEGEGQEADFAGVAQNVELAVEGAETNGDAAAVDGGAGEIKEQPESNQHVEQQHLVREQAGFPSAGSGSGSGRGCGHGQFPPLRLRRPSATTASKMIVP